MTWEFKGDRPIYIQLIEQIQMRIVSGQYPAGSKLPAVRDLAAEASVNPNTMQKALAELERDGLVHTQRTAGRFITEDHEMIRSIREKLAREQVALFFEKMGQLGISREETLRLLQTADAEPKKPEKESA
ncbi:MAG: GntR family transcriptional regulator [Provencibacterium sp.]|jgi:GntR family transcriptional regulator|nr:GntR family transcriptional regulator [Provencibacterium sp.]